MEKDWVKIFTSSDIYRAEITKQMLIENDIDAVLLNKQLSGYNIGAVEVYIHQEDFSKAVEIMALNQL
ncbi:MAG: hypothetical protein EOP47_01885 [Sphingobacteriaceae bacterium]|nr:MAG: hypothetical protein EOP47_01885 [Sphingobacteriaceae bacterium]